jgi:NADPH-dependent glutamate synthase beta subunit-like oxidoreductase
MKRFARKRVDKDWLNTNFPCMMACPAHTNAGRYVSLISEGRFEEAYRYAREPNPLASVCGRVCAHPCESACRRGQIDSPIQIRALKRFLTERYGPESRHPLSVCKPSPEKLPFKVAIIGAGPVGLSAAHDLALMGYSVMIFDSASVAGGMLYLGIPEYRLPRSVIEAQVREILQTGDITLKLNQAAGRDFTVADLRRDFDAVVIAVGAQRGRDLSIPGVDLDGVHKGIDFLLNVNLGYKFTIGNRVIVIGGGNVAMDVARSAAREVVRQHEAGAVPADANVVAVAGHEMIDISLSALRLGASEVHLVCIEPREEMPASEEEIVEAQEEGIILHPGFGPKQILGEKGRVRGIEGLRTKATKDAQGRFNPTFYEGSETSFACDTVILAIGQATALQFLTPAEGIQISSRGLIVADPKTLMTSAPGVFAGGDCVFGPRLIIDSVGDGKRVAVGVDRFLRGTEIPDPVIEVSVRDRHSMPQDFMELVRQTVPMLPLERRTGMTEVEVGFDEASAITEARRCLQCWVNTVFEGTEVDGTECILCGGCVDVCPEHCLSLVPLQNLVVEANTRSLMESRPDIFEVELRGVTPDELGNVTGSVMIKDETRCIRCGLCALRCPVKEITMEAYEFVPSTTTGLIPIPSFDFDEEIGVVPRA